MLLYLTSWSMLKLCAVHHFRQLCSFTHPDLADLPDDVPQQYRGIKALKEALRNHLQRHFCDVCLEGRKVCDVLVIRCEQFSK